MTHVTRAGSLLISLGLFIFAVGCAHVHNGKMGIQQKMHVASEATISADQALHTALHKVPGTVVEMELEEEPNHQPMWEVEIVTADKRLMAVKIDGKTGSVLDVEEENAGY